MIIKNIKKILDFPNQRIVGVDYGDKKIGIAHSDISQKIAIPLKTISRSNIENDINDIDGVLKIYSTNLLVLGLPLTNDGTHGATAQKVRSFANLLDQRLDINIFFWDERFSSKSANNAAFMMDKNYDKNKKELYTDHLAASVFLQNYLDYIKINSEK